MTQASGGQTTVGNSLPRVDGIDKVTGKALYVDDLPAQDALHGITVRSRSRHGVLRAINRSGDFDWSDITVVTAEEIPGDNYVALIEADQPALVPIGGVVRHIDEPVALVAAPTRARAMEAAKHIELDIEDKPGVFTIEDALAADVVLHGDDNVFKRFEVNKGDDIDAAFAGADHVIEHCYHTGAQEQMYIEPQGMMAEWDGDVCRIVGSMQCPYYVHKAMKTLLAADDDSVIISQAVTGGGFGGKEEYPSMLAAHVALLAKKSGKRVKMIYDRDEDIAATTKRHPSRVHHRIGVNNDGTIVAIDVDVVIDGGAYATLSAVVLSRAVLHAAGPYRCANTRIIGRAVATNTPPHGAFRGFGAPQTTFAYERQTAKAARAVGMSPMAFRRHNMLLEGDTTATSQTLTFSVGSTEVLDAVTAKLGNTAVEDSTELIKRGRGMAFYFHGAGFTGSGEEKLKGRATVDVLADGTFEVRSSSSDIGQGSITMFSQITATALGIDAKHVTLVPNSTDRVPDSGPTVASRTCMVVGSVVDQAAQGLRKQIETWAAANDVDASDLVAAAKAMTAATGERVTETVQYTPPPGIKWDDATYTGSAYPVFGWAACIVDVAVDMDSYEVTIERCIHAVDVGKAINPIIVKGQIEGGTLQALGWATIENVVYDDGRVANPTMTDCIVPTFADTPELDTIIIEIPYPYGPHGAKGVGEIPMDGPAAAVANALEDALGVAFDELPALPETIHRALTAGGQA